VTVPDSTASPRRRWRPSLFSVVLTAVGIALFAQLGLWQLDRAEQKEALLTQYEAGRREQIPLTPENADSLSRYQRISVTGRYDASHQILLDNMPSHTGRPGYRVLTPMQTPAGWLLVDRGWLPLGATRAELPNVSINEVEGERNITGTLDALPRAGLQLEAAPVDANAPWPRVLSFPAESALEQQLGHELIAGVLLLDPSHPDGYERIWEAHLGFKPERHIGYAVQWFALAAAAAVIFILLGFRTRKATDERAHATSE
jgi:surfeit locus 1 family protein